uniref:Uncharacterized protein n=1 Tax=Anguilla anguilla TaxID=7936 RepID=A0A0E9PHL4_ANGAN
MTLWKHCLTGPFCTDLSKDIFFLTNQNK